MQATWRKTMRSSCSLTTSLLAGLIFVSLAACAGAAPGDVKNSFDAPCSYPAGLATDGTHLYVLDWREAKIYRVSTTDGTPQGSWDAPTLKPHGLTYGHGKLYISDDHSGHVYALDPKTGVVESHFEAPGSRATGLAWADDALFLLERKSGKIYKVLPEDGTILAYFDVPHRHCTCLAYDGKYLWVSNRVADEFYMVDPHNGMVIAIVDSPGSYPAGLSWLDGHLWNIDFQTRQIYQIIVNDKQKYRLTDTREARIEYLWLLYNYGPGKVTDLRVNLAIPETRPGQELLSEIRYSTPPGRIETDQWGQRCAVFDLGMVAPVARKPLTYSIEARVSAIRYLIVPEDTGTLDDIPESIRKNYTADGSRYRIASSYVQDTARKVLGDEQNTYWIARKIYNFVIDKLEYEMVGGWDVPEVVLKRGSGSCSEYTFAFIALCRAAGLPARYVGSIVVRGDDASVDESFHRWAEIYLPNYGWVPVDANRGDAKTPADQARGFADLANRFLITTHSGGGSEHLGWSYNSFATYKMTGYCKTEEENLGFWEPLETGPEVEDDKAPTQRRGN
jgi:transglutaminase-like putative cysteine protease/sugar lactone lactonase YvrE